MKPRDSVVLIAVFARSFPGLAWAQAKALAAPVASPSVSSPVGAVAPGMLAPLALSLPAPIVAPPVFRAPAAPIPAGRIRELTALFSPGAQEADRFFDGRLRQLSFAGAPAAVPMENAERPSTPEPARKTSAVHWSLAQGLQRLQTQVGRAATMPAYLWPFTSIAKWVSHGEPLVGLTPWGAATGAERLASDGRLVIGRLAWELRDRWSVRGAERSYLDLIDRLGRAKARRPELDIAVSLDAESLGLQLRGASAEERLEVAGEAVLRIAWAARARGLPLELDMGTSDAMPGIILIARRVALELRIPVRLALSARYRSSERALLEWVELARETGLRLGVRLVKGSFIEAKQPDAVNLRGPLIERYKSLVTLALENSRWIDVAVASQNPEIWEHAKSEAGRLGADFSMHLIHGVNLPLQSEMRAAGRLGRRYVSYGMDAPMMGLTEFFTNWLQRRALTRRGEHGQID